MNENNLIDKIDNQIINNENTELIQIKEFLIEYDYATKYLTRLLKVRGFVIYMLLFKRAYFIEGKRNITVKLSDLGKDLLSDLGKPASHEVVKRGVDDLFKLKIIDRVKELKPGQINEYTIKLPSELREVQLMIEEENKELEIVDDSKNDFYVDKLKRIEILKRDEYQCTYCKCNLEQDNFYLDHIFPQSNGGHNWKSNLVSSCKTCNTRKNATNSYEFLLENYRKSLLTQKEYLEQKNKISELIKQYENLV